jgi:hypothetical protein
MARQTARQRRLPPFPALITASLLLAVCVFPGQRWLAACLPGLSGRATLDPGLAIFDIPLHLPLPIDLILVPGLFLILYSVAILTYTSRSHLPVWQNLTKRLGAVFTSVFIILFCVAIGASLSWLLHHYLPAQLPTGLTSMAVNADLHLPNAGFKNIPLHGDIFSLLGLLIGIVIGIRIMGKAPRLRRRTIPLTREQRMTPYQRMLEDRQLQHRRREPVNPTTHKLRHYEPSHRLCRSNPLPSFQPEAVNYRPLE